MRDKSKKDCMFEPPLEQAVPNGWGRSHLVAVVKKKFEVQEKKTLSTTCPYLHLSTKIELNFV